MPTSIIFLSARSQRGGAQRVLLDYLKNQQVFVKKNSLVLSFEHGELLEESQKHGYQTKVLKAARNYMEISRKKPTIRALILNTLGIFQSTWELFKLFKDYDLVFSNAVKTHLIGGIAAKMSGKPFIVRLHDIVDSSEFNWRVKWVLVLSLKLFADKVLVVSEAVKHALIESGINETKIKVIYNGIKIPDKIDEYLFDTVELADDAMIVSVVGRVVHWKGQHVAVKAWEAVVQSYPNAQLCIVGDTLFENDGYADYFSRIVEESPVKKNIHLVGFVDNAYGLMKASDLVLHTSIAPDPLPTVVLESIALGTYVIASNIGGVPEMITDNSMGALYAPGNDSELAKAVIAAISENRLGNKGVNQSFVDKFSMQRYVDEVNNELKLLLTK